MMVNIDDSETTDFNKIPKHNRVYNIVGERNTTKKVTRINE